MDQELKEGVAKLIGRYGAHTVTLAMAFHMNMLKRERAVTDLEKRLNHTLHMHAKDLSHCAAVMKDRCEQFNK